MAYPNYNPYNPNFYQTYPYANMPQMQTQQGVPQNMSMQNIPQQTIQQPQPPVQQQIQNGGFVPVRGEQEARNYPVAPGTSVTFKDETAPYVYTKTMGFSSLDRPVFDKFRLVKENAAETSQEAHETTPKVQEVNSPQYALASDYEALKRQFDSMQNDIDALREQISKQRTAGKSKKDDREEKESEE